MDDLYDAYLPDHRASHGMLQLDFLCSLQKSSLLVWFPLVVFSGWARDKLDAKWT